MAASWSLFFAFVLLSVTNCHAKLCMPDCSEMREGDRVPDPTNCFRFYYCSDPEGTGDLIHSSEPLTCPDGYYFNADVHVLECEPMVGNLNCATLCNPCDVKCTSPGTLIPNVHDCGMFKICLDDGKTIDDSCPVELPFFDAVGQVCSQDPEVCYSICDPCELYCVHDGKVPDPHDCMKYYYCDPPFLSHFDCPADEVFNPETLICEEDQGENCTTLCEGL